MTSLKDLVENNKTVSGRIFDLVIQFLIVLSLVTFSIETLPDLAEDTSTILRYIEIGTVLLFTIEYILRVTVADRKISFIFSFFGLVDLIAILPFYIASGIDLRAIRAFRLLRLFRIFKLVRYSKAVQRFHRALIIAKEEMFFSCALRLYCYILLLLGFTILKLKRSHKSFPRYSTVFGGPSQL